MRDGPIGDSARLLGLCQGSLTSPFALPDAKGVGAGLHGEGNTRAGTVAFKDCHDHFERRGGLAGAGDGFAAVFDAGNDVGGGVTVERVKQLGFVGGRPVRVGDRRGLYTLPGI